MLKFNYDKILSLPADYNNLLIYNDEKFWSLLNNLKVGEKISINMENTKFIRPSNVIMLLLICMYIWKITGENVKLLQIEENIDSYLYRLDFFQYDFIDTPIRFNIFNKHKSNTLVEIKYVKDKNDVNKLMEKVIWILEEWFPGRGFRDFRIKSRTMVAEICNNSIEHSNLDGDGECYCMLQKYRSGLNLEISISVGDLGVGIKGHMKNKYEWMKTDYKSIERALEGYSGRLSKRGGLGLRTVINYITNDFSGDMIVRSGSAAIEIKSGKRTRFRFDHSFPGTQTEINFRIR